MAFPSSVYDRRGDLRLPGPIALPLSGRNWEEGLLGRPYCRIRVLFLHHPKLLLSHTLLLHQKYTQSAMYMLIFLYTGWYVHTVWYVVRMNVDLRHTARLVGDNNAFSSFGCFVDTVASSSHCLLRLPMTVTATFSQG